MLQTDETDVITTTLRAAFEGHAGGSVTGVLDDFGWTDLLRADAGTAVRLVFELLGATGTTAPALSDVMRHGLGPLPAVPSGVLVTAGADPRQAAGRLAGGVIAVDGLCVGDPGGGSFAVGVADADGSCGVGLVGAEGLEVSEVRGLDPWLGLRRVRGSALAFELLPDEAGRPAWASALAWGRLALAAQLVGVVEASLRLATGHAKDRVQFGRPVGTFQAVQHRLADVLVALEAARAAVDVAAERGDELSALVAKSLAGAAASVAGANCLQVLGGVGFTWEHPLHRFQKRGLVLDRLLGSSAELPAVIGRVLTRIGEAPRLAEL
jgi:hypothetical protein